VYKECYFKFSSSPDLSLGFIDILNYTKLELDWEITNKFPICITLGFLINNCLIKIDLAGEGNFFSPLFLDISDPLLH